MESTGEVKKKKFYKRWWFWTIVVLVIIILAASGSSKEPTPTPIPQIQQVTLSEDQCKGALDELYAVDNGGKPANDANSDLVKNLLIQYSLDGGLALENQAIPTVRYTMPLSQCGKTLDELIKVNIESAKSGQK